MSVIKPLSFFVAFFLSLACLAQQQPKQQEEKDSSVDPKAKKAALYGLIPGGGQVYNKSYWKVPVVYAGFGVLTYSLMFYNRE